MWIIMLASVGGAVIAIAVISLLWLVTEYENSDQCFIATFLGFGVVIARSDRLVENCNKVRKTEGRRFFITAPTWFNKYVYNFGVKK